MKENRRPTDPSNLRTDFPIDDRVPGWFFRVAETSEGVYAADGTDRFGRVVSRRGSDPDTPLIECVHDARDVQRQLTEFLDYEEFYSSVALLRHDLVESGYPELATRLYDATIGGSTWSEVLYPLRHELLEMRQTEAYSEAGISERVDRFITFISKLFGGT